MGDKKDEFTEVVNMHSAMLFRYAFWLSGNEPTARDLVQETLLRAWKGFDSLQKRESAKYWLITILRRENARRFERKRLKQVDREVDTIESPSTLGRIDSSPEALALKYALGQISENYRDPLILQVLCGYSCKDIAEQLDLTPEAVMTRLYRAREQLKEILDADNEFGNKPTKSKKP